MNDESKKDTRLDAPRVLRESVVRTRFGTEMAPAVSKEPAPNQASPVHLAELMGIAATIRQCQRNGHPDLSKHLEVLLTKLGA